VLLQEITILDKNDPNLIDTYTIVLTLLFQLTIINEEFQLNMALAYRLKDYDSREF
jgi:hypothetical protein